MYLNLYTPYVQCGLRPIAERRRFCYKLRSTKCNFTLVLFDSFLYRCPSTVSCVQRSKANSICVGGKPLERHGPDTVVSVFGLHVRQCPHHRVRAGWAENEVVLVRSQSSTCTCSSTHPCRRRLEVDESTVGVSVWGEVRSLVQHFVGNNSIQMAIAERS